MNINYFDCLATSPGHLSCDWLALRSVAIFMYTLYAPRSRGGSPVVLSTNNNQLIDSCANGCWINDNRRNVFPISTLVNRRPRPARRTQRHSQPVLRRISTAPAPSTSLQGNGESSVLSLYVLNAAGLTKQHAVEHLASDLNGVDAAVVSETHLGAKHADNIVSVPDYTLFRRDRSICNARGRRMKGGGVAIYVRSALHSAILKYSGDDPKFEVLWVRSGDFFIGAV